MGKVARKEKPRIVKMTSAWPPLTYSYFNDVPRRINHRIKGGLKVTYVPEWVEDTCTKVRYDVSENDDEVRLLDPGGLEGKPRKFLKKRILKRDKKYVKKFVEKQTNGELAEAGFPRGESIAVATNPEGNDNPLVVVAESKTRIKSEEIENNDITDGSGIFEENTQPLEDHHDKQDEFLNDLDKYMDELDYEPEVEVPENKHDPLAGIKTEPRKAPRTKHKEDIKIVKMRRLYTPKTVDFKKDARRKIIVSTPKSEQSGEGQSGSTGSFIKTEAEEPDDYVEFLGYFGKIHADESGSGMEETTFEKQYRLGATNKIEQTDTIEITQPEGSTKPTHNSSQVVYGTQIFSENEEEVYGDGGDRFEEKEVEEFEIRRPEKNPEQKQNRVKTSRHHRGCKLGSKKHTDHELKIDRNDSQNSFFVTPMSQPTTSMARCPIITRKVSIPCEDSRGDTGLDVKSKIKRHLEHEQTQTRMSYARRIVETEWDEEEEEKEPSLRERNSFDKLTLNEELLITGSSENFRRLEQKYGNQKDKYLKLVEKLMWRCGILCKDRMDKDQQKYLKRKTIPDFRRQVRRRSDDYVSHE